jgi:(+)-trans-carveol dehydrogenase
LAGRVEGQVAFITGVARGQGRSHAVRLAEEGADIIGIDACAAFATVPYPSPSLEDLDRTRKEIESLGRRALLSQADVRDFAAVSSALDEGVAQLGRLDIVCANAGIFSAEAAHRMDESTWREMIDVNLTGVWFTCRAAIPHMMKFGRGGSIILTSSRVGYASGSPNLAHYAAAKSGVVGMMKCLSAELAPSSIRVNTVNPTNCETPMLRNDFMKQLFFPGQASVSDEEFEKASAATHKLPIPWVQPIDISNAVLYLASDEARYVTGVSLSIGEV